MLGLLSPTPVTLKAEQAEDPRDQLDQHLGLGNEDEIGFNQGVDSVCIRCGETHCVCTVCRVLEDRVLICRRGAAVTKVP